MRKVLGPSHPETLVSSSHLGYLCCLRGNLTEVGGDFFGHAWHVPVLCFDFTDSHGSWTSVIIVFTDSYLTIMKIPLENEFDGMIFTLILSQASSIDHWVLTKRPSDVFFWQAEKLIGRAVKELEQQLDGSHLLTLLAVPWHLRKVHLMISCNSFILLL